MIKQAEQLYRGIFENAIEGIFQTTVDGKMIASNPALATMLGYSSPEEYIASVSDLKSQHYVNPDLRQIFIDTIEREWYRKELRMPVIKRTATCSGSS